MSTQLQTAFWVAGTSPRQHSLRKLADRTLKAAAGFWFVVAVLGQLVFAFTVASFYGLSAARGHWQQWNKSMTHGYTPGHPMGNLAVIIHLSVGRRHPAERRDSTHSASPPSCTGLSSLEWACLLRDRLRHQPCRSLYDVVPWNCRRPFPTPRPEPRRRPHHGLRRHGAAVCISS